MRVRSNKRASTCVRINPVTGERTQAVKRSTPPAKPWSGGYGLWDNLCQTWRGGPYASLSALAGAFYQHPELQPMRWGGEFNPKPLSRTEQREIQKIMEEAG